MTLETALGKIDELVEQPAGELVRAFYDRQVARDYSENANFVGELFTTLGPVEPDNFTASDLLAVHMLGMSFRPRLTEALLVRDQTAIVLIVC
jgi:hypothetical protein